MIRRYSRDEMRAVWPEEKNLNNWLGFEILACEARKIPKKDLNAHLRQASNAFKKVGIK
jgi:adenylosuccinate lyase